MYEDLGRIKLKSGEEVEMGVVTGPDLEWAERIEALLAHKGEIWTWQNRTVLREETGIEACFTILHRHGVPFANILTAELNGAGILGHVFTRPEDRRKGAASSLMPRQMAHFRERGGQALFLGTGYDSPAYHIYRSNGFEGIEAESGLMSTYVTPRSGFEAGYFAAGSTEIETLGWTHWPASMALFLSNLPGTIRCTPLKVFGRESVEGTLLRPIQQEGDRREQGGRPRVVALRHQDSTGVVGLAARGPDPLWPGFHLVDVYCHPHFWTRAGEMLQAILPDEGGRCLAYSDSDCPDKEAALREAGFRAAATHGGRVDSHRNPTQRLDVQVWERG